MISDGPKMTAGRKITGEKSAVLTEITLQWSVQIFKSTTQHCNTLCICDYLFLKKPWATMKHSDRRWRRASNVCRLVASFISCCFMSLRRPRKTNIEGADMTNWGSFKYGQQQQGRPDHWQWTAVYDRIVMVEEYCNRCLLLYRAKFCGWTFKHGASNAVDDALHLWRRHAYHTGLKTEHWTLNTEFINTLAAEELNIIRVIIQQSVCNKNKQEHCIDMTK